MIRMLISQIKARGHISDDVRSGKTMFCDLNHRFSSSSVKLRFKTVLPVYFFVCSYQTIELPERCLT